MHWILLSLLAPLFWASSNFVDKYILEKHSKGIFDFLFFSTITGWFFFLIFFVFLGMPELSVYSWIPILTGAMLIYSYGFYARALEVGETSVLTVLFKLIPVFTVVLAFVFLGQTLSLNELLGFIIVFAGAIMVSLERGKTFFIKGLGMILVAIFMWSVMILLTDYGLTKIAFWDYFMLDALGSAFAGPILLVVPYIRKQIIEGLKTATVAKYVWFSVDNLLDFFGQTIVKKALAVGPSAGLVMVVTQVQSFYAIALGVFLTIFFPNIISENISAGVLVKKLIGAVVMFIGIYILLV